MRLTVGMPLYNNAGTIRRALDSLLAQSYAGCRIVASDDGSTDGTAEVCDEYARCDSRLRVVRQPKNLNYGNFRYVLRQADTPFFMFAAGDDQWHPEYTRRMIEVLDRDAKAVCAVSRVAFVKDGSVMARTGGTRSLVSDAATNIVEFLAGEDDNSRMYGVFRTAVAQRAFPVRDFYAYDWAFTVGTLLEGTHVEVPEVLMWRDYTDPDRYVDYVLRDAASAASRLFPMLPLTRDLLVRLRIPVTSRLIRQLVRVNVNAHLRYMRRYHPAGATVLERIMRNG